MTNLEEVEMAKAVVLMELVTEMINLEEAQEGKEVVLTEEGMEVTNLEEVVMAKTLVLMALAMEMTSLEEDEMVKAVVPLEEVKVMTNTAKVARNLALEDQVMMAPAVMTIITEVMVRVQETKSHRMHEGEVMVTVLTALSMADQVYPEDHHLMEVVQTKDTKVATVVTTQVEEVQDWEARSQCHINFFLGR